jgi:hypothetical protein
MRPEKKSLAGSFFWIEVRKKMKIKRKRKQRTFKFQNCIAQFGPAHSGPHQWINEVLESIERDEILVFDSKDTSALARVCNEKGEELVEAKATMLVKISDWLAVACQSVRWETELDQFKNEDALASYKNNGTQVLWPLNLSNKQPSGPSAFVGEIILRRSTWPRGDLKATTENSFKMTFAHELVHVFDWMKFIVPAYIDWPRFWKNIAEEGRCCRLIQSKLRDISIFIDDYGHQNEKRSIRYYWPSQVNKWWRAFQRIHRNHKQ